MNNIFLKNISALAKKDSELAQKISSHVVSEAPQLVQENGFYNLIYKGLHLHHKENPLGEAREIFSQVENTPVAIHVIYGIGLGYLFQVASANSLGTVILYETDLNILKIAFTLVDFSNDILKNNVFIADNIQKASDYIYKKSNTKNSPYMLTTSAYRELGAKDFDELVEKLQRMIGSFGLDLRYTKEKFYPLLKFTLTNIPNLVKEPPLCSIKDFYKGKTAVVASAGPTLDRDIEVIKKHRDKIVLFVVGTAMKAIAKLGITPDFLCIIESYDSSKQIEGLDLSEVNLITEPFSHPNYRKFNFKKIYSHISSNLPLNAFWAGLIKENTEDYLSKGTVSYTALNAARILGCSKIIFAGQDLAYLEGQCYSKDSAYKDLVCAFNKEKNKWEITAKDFDKFAYALNNSADEEVRKKTALRRLENLNKSLYYVKSIKGEMIPTESVYAAFIAPLSEYTEMFPDREYINASLEGAQIDGFKNLPLEEALKDSETITNRDLPDSYRFDIPSIIEGLKNYDAGLSSLLERVQSGKQLIRSFNNDLKRYRSITQEILKSLKKISSHYLELSTEGAKQNLIFDFITTAERLELDYEMKMIREFTPESVGRISEKLAKYYENAETKINTVSGLIRKTVGELE